MNRRTLLSALGTIGAGGAIVTGTGAFTSVEANRDLTVSVADDANALLALRPNGPNGDYVDTDGGTVGIDLSGNDGDGVGNQGAQGINADAVTLFEDMLLVENQGTQEVEVSMTPMTFIDPGGFLNGILLVLLVPSSSFPTVTLTPGDTETYSLITAAASGLFDTDLEVDDTITITAEAA